jgi:hypothetical protein
VCDLYITLSLNPGLINFFAALSSRSDFVNRSQIDRRLLKPITKMLKYEPNPGNKGTARRHV